ncbi:MxaK protein [Methylobacterium sp. J-078]|uniref:MxaK protein n=1 Tax=Methylobacterium sp. J-078 TaxID=2836657 RepID=UPI001FBB200F|nr:MxaK protein [Methylobacterium sp. J-078]MCJ2047667.1 MxaK protein [Methylobacterium sp. J-078]
MTTITTLPWRASQRPAAARPRTRRAALRAGWRRARSLLLALLPVLFVVGALGCGYGAWRIARDNVTIRALATGRDIAIPVEAAPSLLLARVQFLARRGAVEAIEPLIESLERQGAVERAARARYALANAHLRQAFDHLERGDLDPAGPRITLARQEYRRALQGRPDYWDAKFNLDVASRLLRDFPDFDRKSGDELKAEPKKIWTDIPGQPRGEP